VIVTIVLVRDDFLTGIPVRGVVAAGKLRIFDEEGALCWEKESSDYVMRPEWEWSDLAFDTVVVADIDADSRNEVLFNLMPRRSSSSGGKLICFDQAGETRWEVSYGKVVHWQGRAYDANYVGRFILPLEARGLRYVLTVASHTQWFPAQVALLDPVSGKLIEEYWHPGGVFYYLLKDLDADGTDEIILGAINNPGVGLGHAALAVLEVPFSRVPAKVEPSAVFTGTREYAYLLFPRPDTSSISATLPVVSGLAVTAGDHIMVKISTAESGAVFYYLNSRLEVEDFRFSDNFLAIHNRYRLMGLLDHDWNEAEHGRLKQLRRFAAAPNANSREVESLWEETDR
jgi:hypothetical protein